MQIVCSQQYNLFILREDDFIDEEENHHRHAAVQNRCADVVDKVRHEQPCHGNPHTVDGVDDASNNAKREDIPADLLAQIALTAEHKVALNGEVDALANDHSNHVRAEIRQTAVGGIVAEDIPLECLAEQRYINPRPAEINNRQAAECSRQELQQ